MSSYLLVPIGLAIGAYGTMVGAGGGFLLVPLLLFLYDDPTSIVTSISLTVVFFNALSGSLAYARQKRIDYKSGLLFALTTLPGAVVGAWATHYIARGTFDLIFGIVLVLVAIDIFVMPVAPSKNGNGKHHDFQCSVTDAQGKTFRYDYNLWLGSGISLVVGFFSNIMGIGGGVLRVPAMVQFLRFPTHIATATAQFVLAFTAAAGIAVHLFTGSLALSEPRTVALTVGVVFGAQIGALLAGRLRGKLLLRLLAVALLVIGARLIYTRFG